MATIIQWGGGEIVPSPYNLPHWGLRGNPHRVGTLVKPFGFRGAGGGGAAVTFME